MPRVNIYIRNEDYALWKNLEDKPKFIHEALGMELDSPEHKAYLKEHTLSTFKSAKDVIAKINPEKKKDFKFCKHDAVLGFCKKGCK